MTAPVFPAIPGAVLLKISATLAVPSPCANYDSAQANIMHLLRSLAEEGVITEFKLEAPGPESCPVCGWEHDRQFRHIRRSGTPDWITLRGAACRIFSTVHAAHERGLAALSTKDDALEQACGGYRHPCKVFDDLGLRAEYKRLFDTRRRGYIALLGFLGMNRNKSEYPSE